MSLKWGPVPIRERRGGSVSKTRFPNPARLYNRRRVPVRFRGGGKTALPGAAEKANVTNEETRRTRSRSNMV